MSKITITEALAEIRTIDKRIEKKLELIEANLTRDEDRRDPLEKEGGQASVIAREKQAIHDLLEHKVDIRLAINEANANTELTVAGTTRTIAEWIVWRREASGKIGDMLTMQSRKIRLAHQRDRVEIKTTPRLRSMQTDIDTTRSVDVVVNVNEAELSAEIEALENTLGSLDGQLSLKNATILIDVG